MAMALTLVVSVAFVVLPVRGDAPRLIKSGCCANTHQPGGSNDCPSHPTKPNQDSQCCPACTVGLALFVASSGPFIYPPTGEEEFAVELSRESARADRPPVPPPRFLPV